MVRVLERVRALALADEVVVATETEEVAQAVRDAGGKAMLTSEAHPSGTDRVAEVAEHPDYDRHEIVVNVQGDEPFMRGDAMAGAIAMVRDAGFDLGTAAGRRGPEILNDPNCVKVVRADDGRALYFSRAGIPFLRDAGRDAGVETGNGVRREEGLRDSLVLQHMGIYAARRDALRKWVSLPPHPLELIEMLEQLRALAAGLAMGVAIVDAPSWGEVNTEDDLLRANAHWSTIAGIPT